jgi:hypothetical protein
MIVGRRLAGLFVLAIGGLILGDLVLGNPGAQGQAAPQRSYIICTIHDAAGPPERKQAFVIDDKAMSVDGLSGNAIRSFTPEKIVWKDESFETTLDRVAGFITINLLSSGDLFSSGPCVRTDGPKF